MRLELSERIRIRESFMSWVEKKGIILDIPKQLLNKMSFDCEDVINENTTGFFRFKINLKNNKKASINNLICTALNSGYVLLWSEQAIVSIINNMNECVGIGEIILPMMFPLVYKSKKISIYGYFDGKNFHISTIKNNSFINPEKVYLIAFKEYKPTR